jgi:hypothetical protein
MQAGLADRDTARIGHWAVWTVMAATLTELWSRLLLPANAPEAKVARAEAEALRQQLLNRARMRSAADLTALFIINQSRNPAPDRLSAQNSHN